MPVCDIFSLPWGNFIVNRRFVIVTTLITDLLYVVVVTNYSACVRVCWWRQRTWAASGDLIPLIMTGLLTQDPPAPGRNSKDPRAIHQNMGTSVGLTSVWLCVCVLFVYLHGHPLYKWSRFPLRCWAAWLREEHYEFTALWLSLTHGSVSIISDVITLISKNLIWSLQMIYITGTAVASLPLHRTKSPERRFFFLNLIWNTTTFMGNFNTHPLLGAVNLFTCFGCLSLELSQATLYLIFHTSVHPTIQNPIQCFVGAGPYPRCHGARGRVHPGPNLSHGFIWYSVLWNFFLIHIIFFLIGSISVISFLLLISRIIIQGLAIRWHLCNRSVLLLLTTLMCPFTFYF